MIQDSVFGHQRRRWFEIHEIEMQNIHKSMGCWLQELERAATMKEAQA